MPPFVTHDSSVGKWQRCSQSSSENGDIQYPAWEWFSALRREVWSVPGGSSRSWTARSSGHEAAPTVSQNPPASPVFLSALFFLLRGLVASVLIGFVVENSDPTVREFLVLGVSRRLAGQSRFLGGKELGSGEVSSHQSPHGTRVRSIRPDFWTELGGGGWGGRKLLEKLMVTGSVSGVSRWVGKPVLLPLPFLPLFLPSLLSPPLFLLPAILPSARAFHVPSMPTAGWSDLELDGWADRRSDSPCPHGARLPSDTGRLEWEEHFPLTVKWQLGDALWRKDNGLVRLWGRAFHEDITMSVNWVLRASQVKDTASLWLVGSKAWPRTGRSLGWVPQGVWREGVPAHWEADKAGPVARSPLCGPSDCVPRVWVWSAMEKAAIHTGFKPSSNMGVSIAFKHCSACSLRGWEGQMWRQEILGAHHGCPCAGIYGAGGGWLSGSRSDAVASPIERVWVRLKLHSACPGVINSSILEVIGSLFCASIWMSTEVTVANARSEQLCLTLLRRPFPFLPSQLFNWGIISGP